VLQPAGCRRQNKPAVIVEHNNLDVMAESGLEIHLDLRAQRPGKKMAAAASSPRVRRRRIARPQ